MLIFWTVGDDIGDCRGAIEDPVEARARRAPIAHGAVDRVEALALIEGSSDGEGGDSGRLGPLGQGQRPESDFF